MSNVSYDLDTSGGLMPLIRALIKPPDEETNTGRTKKSQHPYYRRPGKGHNHDCCDACQEGGDLICCDRCPASFHLGCHDPPLEESDIPMGQWLCLECRASGDKPRAPSPTASHRSFEGEKKSRSLRANRSNSAVSSASSSSRKNEREKAEPREAENKEVKDTEADKDKQDPEKDKDKEKEKEKEKEEKEKEVLTPMEVLVRAARVMNPTQFQLPREMQVYCPFPGTEKPVEAKSNGKQAPHMKDQWGCVPLPARLCFHCRQSCRAAPLLQCDYCPLLYHQDCLDPPLTALPSGRWMCPNHVEQFIDWQLVNTISATERIALWQRLSGPVDQHAIRVEFLRKARRPRPMFRVRVPGLPPRGRVRVPSMVKHHYRKRPPLLPGRRETIRCRSIMKTSRNCQSQSDEEDEKKKIICMNLHCPRYLTKNSACEHGSDSDDSLDEQEECAKEDLKAIEANLEQTMKRRKSEEVLLDISDAKDESKTATSPKRRKLQKEELDEVTGLLSGRERKESEKRESKGDMIFSIVSDNAKEMKEILFSVEEQLKKLDNRLVKLLAFQRLQQLIDGANADLDDSIAEIITKSIDKSSLSKYGFKHVALPSELLSRVDVERISREVCGAVAPRAELQRLRGVVPPPPAPAVPPRGHAAPISLLPSPSLSALPVRATLCPVERPARNGLGDGLGRPVPMRLSRLSIGLGGGCDLQLHRYGTCSFVSERHALIFYDEVTHHFELINYSEFGSMVNGQLYSCDFTERKGSEASAGGTAGEGAEDRAAALREIASKRRGGTKGDTQKGNSLHWRSRQ